ncbi:hypothetical protein GOB92_31755 [Sinorhizobium meliloti]|nr:hypothetical protein [Sinorhizobium meliloti]
MNKAISSPLTAELLPVTASSTVLRELVVQIRMSLSGLGRLLCSPRPIWTLSFESGSECHSYRQTLTTGPEILNHTCNQLNERS